MFFGIMENPQIRKNVFCRFVLSSTMILCFSITAKIDDDMVAYYCNEDLFLLELKAVDEDLFDITFVELMDH